MTEQPTALRKFYFHTPFVQSRTATGDWFWRLEADPDKHFIKNVPGTGWWRTYIDGKPIDTKSTTVDGAIRALRKKLPQPLQAHSPHPAPNEPNGRSSSTA